MLRDIVEEEYNVGDTSKSMTVNSMVDVMSYQNEDIRIGQIKFKMRMRKKIDIALKWFQENNAIKGRDRDGEEKTSKRVVNVSIVECRDLVSKQGDPSQIAPFCYYQFYTFDDHYSSTSAGSNPRFDDMQTYQVEMNDKFKSFASRETLDIHVFDDNAPIAEDDKDAGDDIIGTAAIPLVDLVKGTDF